MDTYHWDVLATYHRDAVGCFIWDFFETLWRRTDGTSLLSPFETSLRRSNNTLWRRTTETSWWRSIETSLGVSLGTYLRRRWNVQREKSLLRRHDVLMSGGWLVRQLRQFFKDANCLLLSFFFLENYRFCQKYGNVTNSRGWGESCCNTTWKLIHDSPLSCIKLRVAICILVCIMWVIRKIDCFIRKCSILVKIRGSMFCVTNRCRKVIAN